MENFEGNNLTNYEPSLDLAMEASMIESRANVQVWLEHQMGRAGNGIPASAESGDLIQMLDDFKDNRLVWNKLELMTEMGGDRTGIFRSLHSAGSEMVDDGHFKERHPDMNGRVEAAQGLVEDLIDQWPIIDKRGERINRNDYENWLNEIAA